MGPFRCARLGTRPVPPAQIDDSIDTVRLYRNKKIPPARLLRWDIEEKEDRAVVAAGRAGELSHEQVKQHLVV